MTDPSSQAAKRPASQYYWGDWWKDKGLHSCSLTARGLWHEMNCLMHEGEPYGHLTLNGKPMTVQQLANQCRITATICKKLLDELTAAGVPSKAESGALYSRRMVRDEATREARAQAGRENGAKGKEFGVLGAEHGGKGGRPRKEENPAETPPTKPGVKPPKNPHPSSSSSSSSSKKKRGAKAPLSAESLPTWMQSIIDAFHEVLPELPGVRVMNAERLQALADFREWVLTTHRPDGTARATDDQELVVWTSNYFRRARSNDWIMGRVPRGAGHENWRPGIEYLLSAKGMQKVVEQTVETAS